MHGATGPIHTIPVTLAASNNQSLVAAVGASGNEPNKKIRVLGLFLTAAAAGTVTLHDGSANNLTGALNIAAAAPIALQKSDCGWGDTAADQALQADSSVAATGVLVYQLVN